MTNSYQDFIDFEFNHFVDELYQFHTSEEYKKSLEMPSIQKKFLNWAWEKFQKGRKPLLDLRWVVISRNKSVDQLTSDAAEIKQICSEIDMVTGGKKP